MAAREKKNNDTRENLLESVPPQIAEAIREASGDHPVLLSVRADLTHGGLYGSEWLILSGRHLFVAAIEGCTGRIRGSWAIDTLDSVEILPCVGSATLMARSGKDSTRVVAFSDAKHSLFARAAEFLGRIIAGRHTDLGGEELRTATGNGETCRRCGRALPPGRSSCSFCSHKGRTFLRILDFSVPYTRLLALILLFMILSTGFGLVTPYISKLFIDRIFRANPVSGAFDHAAWLPCAAAGLFIAYTVQIFLGGIRERLSGSLGYKTVYDVRTAIYKRLQELSLSYFDRHQTGSLLSRVNQDTSELQMFIVDFFPISLESLILLFGVGAFLFALSWKLTLFVMIPVAASTYFLKEIFPRIGIHFHRYFHRRSRLSAHVNDSLSGIRIIKAFGRETEETQKFDMRSATYRDAGVELTRQWSIYHPVLQFFIMTGGVVVWWVGGGYVLEGEMTLGTIVAYTGYLSMFYQPVLTLARLAEMLTNSLSAAERVFDVIDTRPEIVDAADAVPMPLVRGRIEFRGVTFGYDPLKPTVRDLRFTIGEHETVGLVGRSGSGKSTIINLLCRLYDPQEGTISLDGIDLRAIRHADLRRHIGVVLQETFLFNGTIYDNIAYARPDACKRDIIEAAIMANAHDFIVSKPDGYDTEVGERGGRLSGGERQRISIARAILLDPSILILDEATASVDTRTEHQIQEALETLKKNRTTIAIAHRLSTLRGFDRLLVIDDGALAEQGTHKELIGRRGIFYELLMLQQKLSSFDGETFDEAA